MHEVIKARGLRTINVSGDLEMEEIHEMRATLEDCLRRARRTVVHLEEVTSMHFAFVPLFCSAHKTSLEAKKTLELTGVAGTVRSMVKALGFSREKGCDPVSSMSCLWVERDGRA